MADEADLAQKQMELMDEIREKQIQARRPIKRAFDWCIDCGEKIESARLKAIPHAERCIGCQEDFEKFQKQYGG
jgi:phage/conjugal plasmid C-4 type zinc finger TraR family protein